MKDSLYHESAQDPDLLIDDLPKSNVVPLHGPLDRPIPFTWFPNQQGGRKKEHHKSLRQIAATIRNRSAASKAELPWLKLARFGDLKSPQGCLRRNANVLAVSGIEGDYDRGTLSVDDAARLLQQAGVAALIYTSASHTPEAPRWRVLAPLSREHEPGEREGLCARLNGALGGVLDGASFTLSQSYYYGAVDGKAPVETRLVDGDHLDLVDGVTPLGKDGGAYIRRQSDPHTLDALLADPPPPVDWDAVESALECIPADCDYHSWIRIGMALHHATAGGDEGFTIWSDWSQTCGDEGRRAGDRELESQWNSFGRGKPDRAVTLGSLFNLAKMHGYEMGRAVAAEASDFDDLPALAATDWASDPDNLLDGDLPGGDLLPGGVSPREIVSAYQNMLAAGDGSMELAHRHNLKRLLQRILDGGEVRPKTRGPALEWFHETPVPKTAPYLVRGILDQGATSCMYGASNSGKTFAAVDLCFALATAQDDATWNGARLKRSAVLYCALEGGSGFQKRIRALQERTGCRDKIPFAYRRRGANLLAKDSKGDVPTIISAALELRQDETAEGLPLLIVIDTLSRALAGGDENGPQDMTAFIANVDKIREATGAHVMIVHHTGKDQAKGMRGHSSLLAAIDSELEVTRPDAGRVVSLRVGKQRDARSDYDLGNATLKTVQIGTDEEGDTIESAVLEWGAGKPVKAAVDKLPASQRVALEHLEKLQPANRDQWRDACVEDDAFSGADTRAGRRTAFNRALQGLVAGKWVRRDGAHYSTDGGFDDLPERDTCDTERHSVACVAGHGRGERHDTTHHPIGCVAVSPLSRV